MDGNGNGKKKRPKPGENGNGKHVTDSIKLQSPFGHLENIKQRAFLKAFCEDPHVGRAAEASGISESIHWHWRKNNPEYRTAFAECRKLASIKLEDEAYRRAHDGVRRLKFTGKGEPIIDPATGQQYYEHDYSDMLLVRLLQANMPKKYGRQDATAGNSTSINIQFVGDFFRPGEPTPVIEQQAES